MFNDLLLNDLTSLSHSFVNTLSRLFVHSSSSTLAALNIGYFGCGMMPRVIYFLSVLPIYQVNANK